MDITSVLKKYYSNAEWIVTDEDYNQLQWFSEDIPKPTILEVEAKIVELRTAEPMRLLRKERDRLIAETDWWAVADRTMTDEQLAYRQALRDLPSTATPVLDDTSPLGISGVTWPTKP
jgi:3-methyladenine DNA glycosylase AlkD